ncbi:MAG: SusC/RagA family TonB-linked outer membrane protein [Muribaculaceae bacterium]|nr:SusC/RagA family TonB-linked outer membrane protein [Muribaculaceae bacterium]
MKLKSKICLSLLLLSPVVPGHAEETILTDSLAALTEDTVLDEVVVTALGIGRERKSLGYAVSDLSEKDINTSGVTSITSAIQGKVSGVDIRPSSSSPGASSQIVIRGARSFSDSNRPLYVIDGMPVAANPDFSTGNSTKGANLADRSIDFNPEDIESISFLKGQAASALYGIRASNGVIIITTKRAHKKTPKPTITFSTNLSGEVLSRRFHPQEIYSQGTNINTYNPNAATNWGPAISSLPDIPKYGGNSQGHPGMYYNPKLEQAGLDPWTAPAIYDNIGDFFNTGFTENTSLSISQALANATYSFGLNNSYQKGVVPTTDMNRWNVRGLVDWKLAKDWKTGFSANYSSVSIHSAPGANSAIVNTVYQAPAEYNLKGIPFHIPGDPSVQVSYRPTVYDNPYWWAENNQYYQHTSRGFGNAYLEYMHYFGSDENMSIRVREQAGLDIYTTNNSDILEVGSAGSGGGSVNNYGVSKNNFNNLFTVDFNALFNSNFDFNAMLGSEIENRNAIWRDYTGSNLNFYGMPTIGNATVISGREYSSRSRSVGFFGSVSLGWKSMLFLNVTGRTDIVSSMPRNHRTFFYPSVSLAWIFTELPALRGNSILNYGKLRVSFAEVGQAGSYRENYLTIPTYSGGMYTYSPVVYPINGVTAYVPYQQVYDPNLRPQNTRNIETGFDLEFFNRRLKVSYTLAYQDVKDQIFSIPTAGSTGYRYMLANAGRIRTWSNEIDLQGVILRAPDYELNVGVNLSTLDNKVVELAPGVESIMLGGFTSPQIRAEEGHTYPSIYGTAFQRTEDGQLLLSNGLPVATAGSICIADCTPDLIAGFNLNGRWKRLALSATLSWQNGGRMYHGTNMTLNYSGVTKESIPWHEGTFIAEGIDKATGEPNTVEVDRQKYYQAYYAITESGVYDMSFVKLRDITLSYDLPKFGPFQFQLFAFARNVLLWAKMPNFDPESSQGNGNMGGYFERFSMPATTSIGGGFKVVF